MILELSSPKLLIELIKLFIVLGSSIFSKKLSTISNNLGKVSIINELYILCRYK